MQSCLQCFRSVPKTQCAVRGRKSSHEPALECQSFRGPRAKLLYRNLCHRLMRLGRSVAQAHEASLCPRLM
eukprot:558630-Pyramimonas_sp.AAC.1